MSTRSTLWYSEDFHLYEEGFDTENVYLEVRNTPYLEPFVLRIPLTAWKEMRTHTIEPAEHYLDLTDEEMRSEAERAADEHQRRLENIPDSKVKGLAGSLLFGGPESTREEMINNYLRVYRPALAKNSG